jgi:hypothetical protein
MSTLQPDQIDTLKSDAAARFAPLLLQEALRRLCDAGTSTCLDQFEKTMVAYIDGMQSDDTNAEALKEYGIQLLYNAIKEVKAHPETRHPAEDVSARRTAGRSENPATLEEQLQKGLEDSFPASDPPAVVSTVITGARIVGVEDHLREREADPEPEPA